MGGKPNPGTPADRRLRENHDKSAGGPSKPSVKVSDKPWDGSASRYSDAASYADACLINENTGPRASWTKAKAHLPVREPDGTLNRVAMGQAAAALAGGRGGGVQAPPAAKKDAARKLMRLYQQIDAPVPATIKNMAS